MGSPSKKPRLCNTILSEETNTQDLINNLPDECICEIFSFLPSTKDRCSCTAVSKKWLYLLANMHNSEFKSVAEPLSVNSSPLGRQEAYNDQSSRYLDAENTNDTRLAAMVVGICCQGGLNELCISESFISQGITDLGLGMIAKSCPGLKSLSLWSCKNMGNKGLESVAGGCNLLERLDLMKLPAIDDSGLVAIARNCPSLSTLSIESCPLIGEKSLQTFAEYSSKLISISLVKYHLDGAHAIISILSNLPNLLKLKCVSMGLSDGVLEAIGRHGKSLVRLSLQKISGITQFGFCSMGVHKNLRFLSLKSCSGLDDVSFKAIGESFTGMKKISIRNCETLTDKGLKELTKSTSMLESLKLGECNNITLGSMIEVFTNCGETLKILSLVKCQRIAEEPSGCSPTFVLNYPSLSSLTVKKCYIVKDAFLAWIAQACGHLEHLCLKGLRLVTDEGVVPLIKEIKTETKRLVSVDLGGCSRITYWSVFIITTLVGNKLQSLQLEGCEWVGDRSLRIIVKLCPRLAKLDVSRCDITDDGVFYLATLMQQDLQVVSLAGCVMITDCSMPHIEMLCGRLVGFNLKYCTGLSQLGLDSLRKAFQRCVIQC